MKSKSKILFLALTLVSVLILVSAVNATNMTDQTNDNTISEKISTPATSVIKEETTTKEKIETTKNKEINKTNKTKENTKTSTQTVEVNNFNELSNAIKNAVQDSENEEYTINLNEGTYQTTSNVVLNAGSFSRKITINANNQTLTSSNSLRYMRFNNKCEVILDNARVEIQIQNYADNITFSDSIISNKINNRANMSIVNHSTINTTITNTNGYLMIDDTVIIGENFEINGNLSINTNNTAVIEYCRTQGILLGTNIIENTVITNNMTNIGNLTLINCSFVNNEVTVANSNTNGFFLNNLGNTTMINCILENNTFNTTATTNNINLYGCIINRGTLDINNCTFRNNHVGYPLFRSSNEKYVFIGSGSVIFNRATVNINNSIFEDNYAGNEGGAISGIYGNLNISNSIFRNNSASTLGGSITAKTSYIKNTTFKDNYVMNTDSYSTEERCNGGAICSDNLYIEDSIFESNHADSTSNLIPYQGGGAISSINITSINSTFKNNYVLSPQGAVYNGSTYYSIMECGMGGAILLDTHQKGNYYDGFANITENTFIGNKASVNGSALYLVGLTSQSCFNINNNEFINNLEATETIYINNYEPRSNGYGAETNQNYLIFFDIITNITNNKYTNNSIGFKKIELNGPNKAYTGDEITIELDILLEHPEFYDEDILEETNYTWYINGETITNKETSITQIINNNNIIIYAKPSIANTRTKIYTLSPTILNDIIITPENINNYLLDGELIVAANSRLIFQGEFTDIGEISNDKNEVLLDGSKATFTNTYFVIEANNNTIKNMTINNTNTNPYTITVTGNDNTITNNTLTQYNNQGRASTLFINGINNQITHNNIKISGPAIGINYAGGSSAANTQAILLTQGENNLISYNNITVTNSTNPEESIFSTIEAITAPRGRNNTISYNNIYCTGARFNYAIDLLNNVQDNKIIENKIIVTGYRYADGIQIGDGATDNLILNNNIEITCLNDTPVDEAAISYGIIITSQGGQTSDNNTVTQNKISINGIINYGMEIYTATNTNITDNTITLTGAKSMGIGYAHSPNSTVTGNTIKTNDDSTIPTNNVTEEIQPLNVGIQIQQDSKNIIITNNTIQTYDKQGQDNTINIESYNIKIMNNKLTSSTKVGNDTIKGIATIINNTAIQQESSTNTREEIVLGDSTTLEAEFYDDKYVPIREGKAIFKVNGKTLRDNNGNVIYADVINGRAELPDVNITQEWTKEGTTIQAVYVGDDNNEPITTTPTTITVTKPEATITIDAPTEATAGTTITLKATVTDGENNITSGRVAFKLNGKTLKNAEGKTLYANVQNGIATITYTIPAKTKAKEYTLTAVYTDTNYDRVEAESNLNVVKT